MTDMRMADIRDVLDLRKIINAAGPVSALGGGVPCEAAIAAAVAILPLPVDVAQLQAVASKRIAAAFGCEAGCVTAGSAAGIAVAVAAAMTGLDRKRVAQLPNTAGMKRRVILQRGHDANFGVLVSQMIRLTGAAPDMVGSAQQCQADELRGAIRPETAAAIFVVSHHTAQSGMIPLSEFCAVCHESGVPVIVDAAGEHDPRDQLSAGADLVIASSHKNYGALTAGILAGRKGFVEACLLQDAGIGRPMKVGKEGIVSVVAALHAWQCQNRNAAYVEWKRRASLAVAALSAVPGLRVELAADMQGSPLIRARIHAKNCDQIVTALADGEVSIRVWQHGLPHGFFELDPRTVDDDEMQAVCRAIRAIAVPH
jgi:L-seryl-tRNA(Ser) seleniumtransferase